ncbi:MAG TPA: hypothetical protein VJA21_27905 [Verrucomicrobiae bacterium]
MNIVLISDFHFSEVPGGAEWNDRCLESSLSRQNNVTFLTTEAFNARFSELENVGLFVFSNFYFLSAPAEEFARQQNYLIIEHDYKFTRTRNPLLYQDFIVPPGDMVHERFYANARVVVVQSRLQLAIFQKNLPLRNYYCLGGNLWPDDELDLMEEIAGKPKNGKAAILDADSPGKGTRTAFKYCGVRGIPCDLIREAGHIHFLRLLGRYSSFVFLPSTPESFSRVCLEAKMMGLKVVTHDLVGAAGEELFRLQPREVVKRMREKKEELVQLIRKFL